MAVHKKDSKAQTTVGIWTGLVFHLPRVKGLLLPSIAIRSEATYGKAGEIKNGARR